MFDNWRSSAQQRQEPSKISKRLRLLDDLTLDGYIDTTLSELGDCIRTWRTQHDIAYLDRAEMLAAENLASVREQIRRLGLH